MHWAVVKRMNANTCLCACGTQHTMKCFCFYLRVLRSFAFSFSFSLLIPTLRVGMHTGIGGYLRSFAVNLLLLSSPQISQHRAY